jgi:DNA-binding response OmpR family regulator
MRILIVEDDPVLGYTAMATLEAEGHDVIGPALNVREALQWAESEQFDLAMVDVNLDGNDEGVDLARTLRGQFGVPAIFVSAQTSVARANQDAALGLLRKPFEPQDLVDAVLVGGCLMNGGWPPPAPIPRAMEIFNQNGDLGAARVDG